jgi:hypothetical protein
VVLHPDLDVVEQGSTETLGVNKLKRNPVENRGLNLLTVESDRKNLFYKSCQEIEGELYTLRFVLIVWQVDKVANMLN